MDIEKNVKSFAFTIFTLLGVLFGAIIMTFIFAQLGSDMTGIEDNTITKINVSGTYINSTGFTIAESSLSNFNGGFSVIQAINASSGQVILSGNYTVNAVLGILTNATVTNWDNVNLTYSYSEKTSIKLASESIQNNSLNAIVTYTEQSDTQFLTVAIAVTLVILIGLFALFWRFFIKDKGGKGKGSKGSKRGENFM